MDPIRIQRVTLVDRAVELQFNNGKSIKFEDCWLRDHCRCSSCYHADTFQRAKHILDIPDVTVADVRYNDSELIVNWIDEHTSVYPICFLTQFDHKTWKESRKLKPILWTGEKVAAKVARVHVDKFLKSVEGAKTVFQSILDYGVALIEGVEPNLQATEEVCNAFGGVQRTIYGDMWEFTTRADHADTAYTNLPLAVHNDNTYFTEAAGLQILHCLEHTNGIGGKTLLVDGFYGALCMKEEHPEDYDFLTTFDVEAEYLEEGHHHTYSAPVIRVDRKTQEVQQIRYNVYDRAPMAFENSLECKLYYRSLRNIAKYYQDPQNQWKFKLRPGIPIDQIDRTLKDRNVKSIRNRLACVKRLMNVDEAKEVCKSRENWRPIFPAYTIKDSA